MTKELNEDSGFKVSIKTLVGIGAAMANQRINTYGKGKLMATKTKLKAKKKRTKHIGDELRKKYGH